MVGLGSDMRVASDKIGEREEEKRRKTREGKKGRKGRNKHCPANYILSRK